MDKILSLLRGLHHRISSSKKMSNDGDRAESQSPPDSVRPNDPTVSTTGPVGGVTNPTMETLLTSFLHDKAAEDLYLIPRFHQRLNILKYWSIAPGSRVLDVGCGQGESALSLALQLGPHAKIMAMDTARPDYGAPYTIAQSHAHIRQTELGKRIDFSRTDAETLLGGGDGPVFEAATTCHSLWYFPNARSIASLFQALAVGGVQKLYLAEYDFASTGPTQLPHVFAARAQALLHKYKTVPEVPDPLEQNIRAALDVDDIRSAAREAGFEVAREGHFTPVEDMLEGHFEVRFVIKERLRAAVNKENLSSQQQEEIFELMSKTQAAFEPLEKEGLKTRAMDVWWAELRLEKKRT